MAIDRNTEEFCTNEMVKLHMNLLIFFGYHKPPGKSFSKDIIYVGRVLLFIGLLLAALLVSESVYMYFHVTDIRELPKASFLYLTHLVQMMKLVYIFTFKSRFQKLLDNIQRKEFQPKTLEQRRRLTWYNVVSQWIFLVGLSACFVTCALWAIFPFAEEEYRVLPLPGWYPFSLQDSPVYELVFIYQTIGVLVSAFANAGIDCLITALIMVVCSQLNVLNDSLQNIRELAMSELDESLANTEDISAELQIKMDEQLEECVIHHKCILEFADEVTFLFSTSVLGQFVVSVIIICTTLFEMSLVPVTSLKFISLIFYQYCMLMEIFIECYFGNEVIVESSKLTNFAFNSDWRCCSRRFKRNLLIFMTRSQKELKLYAGGFFTLSLDTFVNILKSSWSYFAVLIQVNKETP